MKALLGILTLIAMTFVMAALWIASVAVLPIALLSLVVVGVARNCIGVKDETRND